MLGVLFSGLKRFLLLLFVIKTLYPDPDRYRIEPKMLDPGPGSMNPDPKYCPVAVSKKYRFKVLILPALVFKCDRMRIRILNLELYFTLIFLQCGGVTKQHYRQMVQLDESNIEIQVHVHNLAFMWSFF